MNSHNQMSPPQTFSSPVTTVGTKRNSEGEPVQNSPSPFMFSPSTVSPMQPQFHQMPAYATPQQLATGNQYYTTDLFSPSVDALFSPTAGSFTPSGLGVTVPGLPFGSYEDVPDLLHSLSGSPEDNVGFQLASMAMPQATAMPQVTTFDPIISANSPVYPGYLESYENLMSGAVTAPPAKRIAYSSESYSTPETFSTDAFPAFDLNYFESTGMERTSSTISEISPIPVTSSEFGLQPSSLPKPIDKKIAPKGRLSTASTKRPRSLTNRSTGNASSSGRNRERAFCTQCAEYPDGFRGEHELRRHILAKHVVEVKKWMCVMPEGPTSIVPLNSFEDCKACRSGKHYGADYNAAAHLRRAHFQPKKPRGRSNSNKPVDPVPGDHPSMQELRPYVKSLTVSVIANANMEQMDQLEMDSTDYMSWDGAAGFVNEPQPGMEMMMGEMEMYP